jgi:hypothetical protein
MAILPVSHTLVNRNRLIPHHIYLHYENLIPLYHKLRESCTHTSPPAQLVLSSIFTCLWFDVTLQSDARKVPVETSVSAQLYVMTPDSLCCYWKRQ